MATKTFKTRIKLKYDLQSNWLTPPAGFSALNGELLLGKDAATPTKVFANVGTEAGIKPLSIFTENVWLDNTTNLAIKLTAIDTALGAGGSVAQQITAAINDLDVAAFELAKPSNGNIVISGISEANGKIEAATSKDFTIVVEGAYSETNPLVAKSYVDNINTNLTNSINAKANQTDLEALEEIVGDHGTRLTAVEGKASANETAISGLDGRMEAVEDKAINNTEGDDWVYVDLTDNKLTVNHKNVTRNAATGMAVEVGSGTNSSDFTIPNLEFDDKGHVTNFGTTTIIVKTPNASDLGLSAALKFIGVTTSEISDESTTNPIVIGGTNKTVTTGDVVIKGQLEFAWDGGKWVELGNASQVANDLSDLQVRMEEAEGNITAVTNKANENANNIASNDQEILALQGLVGNTSVAGQIETAINALDNTGETIASVNNDEVTLYQTIKQADGIINIASENNSITLAKVAKTGAASNVTVADTNGNYTNDDVESILVEIATSINSLEDNIGTGSVAEQIETAIDALDGSATIATVADDVVTLKADITETNGVISNTTASDITLAKVAKTGEIADLNTNDWDNFIVFDCGSATDNGTVTE